MEIDIVDRLKIADISYHPLNFEAANEIERLRLALDCLVSVVGLTAFKYEYQKKILEEAMTIAQAALRPIGER